jgi:hypothetical protein
MSSTILFGPATILHDAVNIGKTFGGGSLQIKSITEELIGNTYTVSEIPYAVEGTINLFSGPGDTTLALTTLANVYNAGVVEIIFAAGTIVLYNAELKFPSGLSFGTLSQNPFTLRVLATPNESGNIMRVENDTGYIVADTGAFIVADAGTFLITE